MSKATKLNWLERKKVGVDMRLKIYDMLDGFITAGIGLKFALQKMQETEKMRRGKSSLLYKIYGIMLHRLSQGKKLGDLFEGIASESERMVLNSSTNDTKASFRAAIDVATVTRKMNKSFYGAQIYPVLLYIIAYGFLAAYSVYFLPQLLEVLPANAPLSMLSEVGLWLNKNAETWIPAVGIINISFLIIIALALPAWTSKLRVKFERIPPFNMYRIMVGCGWLIAIAGLIRSGIKMDQAMEQLSKFGSPYLRHRIYSTVFYLKRGSNLGIALTKTGLDFPDPDMVDRINVYAQGKDFAQRIDILAKEFAERGIEKINSQANIVRTLGLMVVALVALTIIGVNFSISTDLTDAAGRVSTF